MVAEGAAVCGRSSCRVDAELRVVLQVHFVSFGVHARAKRCIAGDTPLVVSLDEA